MRKPPAASGHGRRIAALVRKEALQVVRDPSSILIAGVLPLLLLFLFGYGVSLDLQRIAIGLVVEQPTPATGSFMAALMNSPTFEVRVARHRAALEEALVAGRIKGIVVLAADFPARAARGDTAPIQVIVDGTEPNSAGLVQNYIQGAWRNWQQQEAIARGRQAAPPITLEPRVWYNPELESRNFLVPGSIAIIMTLIGALLTALVVAREWERGTMEALLATPAGTLELLAGKFIPYFVLGMGSMALSVGVAVLVFGVPLRGSVLLLALVSAVFLCAALGLGLLISTLAPNQFVASQIALIAAFLPAFLLSGLLFEISSMPWPIQLITYVMPARYFVSSLQTLFLAGNVPDVIVPNLLAMAGLAAALLAATVRASRTRLE